MHDDHDHIDGGLEHDLPLVTRRRALAGLVGGAGLVLLSACGSDAVFPTPPTTAADGAGAGPGGAGPGTAGSGGSGVSVGAGEIPEETAGPFPGDGSNGANVLDKSGIVRRDLRPSFAGATGVAEGVELTVRLKVVDVSEGSAGLAGAAVYLWHCDREGRYSLYEEPVLAENYLRGVQAADADGVVEFTTVFPGAYSGRWPHMHFEVYESLAKATSVGNKMRTSQLALPEDACRTVYTTDGYAQSVSNLARLSLETDGVFADGYALQLATVTGTPLDGLTATLTVPV